MSKSTTAVPPTNSTKNKGIPSNNSQFRAKKRRKLLEDGSKISVSLNEDALANVLHFLTPKQLLRMSTTCKSLRSNITLPMVIKSAMIHGGTPAKTIDHIQRYCDTESIFVPSALRLLRLLNAKLCEICFGIRRGMQDHTPGVYACWGCVTNGRNSLTCRTSAISNNRAVVTHPRIKPIISISGSGDGYMWRKPMVDKGVYDVYGATDSTEGATTTGRSGDGFGDDGVKYIGPIVSAKDIIPMCNHEAGVDDYFCTQLRHVPSKENYNEFLDAYNETKRRANAVSNERKQKKIINVAIKEKTKKAKFEKLLADMTPLINESIRDIVIKQKKPAFVREIWSPYLSAPSKIRKKTAKELADKINGKFQLIQDKGFPGLALLSDHTKYGIFGNRVKEYCNKKWTTLEEMVEVSDRQIDLEILVHLENNNLFTVIGSLLKKNSWDSRISFCLFLLPEGSIRDTALDGSYHTSIQPDYRQLADAISDSAMLSDNINDDSYYAVAFNESIPIFDNALRTIEEYNHWLDEKYPDTNISEVTKTENEHTENEKKQGAKKDI